MQSDLKVSKRLVVESITANCFGCRVEMEDNGIFSAKGNPTDCALVNFIMDNDVEAHSAMKEV